MIDPRADDFEGVVHVGEGEEGFALDVGFGDVEGVEGGGVVVEDAEEVVVVADCVAIGGFGGGGVLFGNVRGGCHGMVGGEGAEEARFAVRGRGRLSGDGRWLRI